VLNSLKTYANGEKRAKNRFLTLWGGRFKPTFKYLLDLLLVNHFCFREVNQMAKKPAFGGYSICFKGCKDSMESVFGSGKIAPSEMTKKLWAYVKKKKIAGKK
jgi:hypothetical protein